MKILAATTVNYGRTRYIVELNSDELASITTFHGYAEVPVTGADGVHTKRDKDKLIAGDEISEEVSKETITLIRTLIDDSAVIATASGTIRGSLTKIQNALKNAR